MKMRPVILFLLAIAGLAALPEVKAQSLADSGDSASSGGGSEATTVPQPDSSYLRPTAKTEFHNYLFDTLGPYPIVGAAVAAGINQAESTPPEWKPGAEAYGQRFASNFAIAGISTTTRYALAEAFREDTLYYRCECKGLFPRLGQAVVSTFLSRHGEDGGRVFSLP